MHNTIASVEDDNQNLNLAGIEGLPGNLSSKLPSQEDAEKIFEEKCKKSGGEAAYERGNVSLFFCTMNLIIP